MSVSVCPNIRNYVQMIDLTKEDSGSDSPLSDLPIFECLSATAKYVWCVYITFNDYLNFSSVEVNPFEVKHVLLQHRERVLLPVHDTDDLQRMNIRRSHLLEDSIRQFSKHSFDVRKKITVRFVGEQSVDDGGPQREYFHLLIQEIFKTSCFAGYPENVVLLHNVEALSSNRYYVIGKMIAASIIHAGAPLSCLASAVADFIVWNQVKSPVCIDNIPDYEVQACLKEVHSCN